MNSLFDGEGFSGVLEGEIGGGSSLGFGGLSGFLGISGSLVEGQFVLGGFSLLGSIGEEGRNGDGSFSDESARRKSVSSGGVGRVSGQSHSVVFHQVRIVVFNETPQ